MMLTVVLLNLSMASFRPPAIALMPDITPPGFRIKANGVFNFMGELEDLLVYFGDKPLCDGNVSLPFLAGGTVKFGARMRVVLFNREPRQAPGSRGAPARG